MTEENDTTDAPNPGNHSGQWGLASVLLSSLVIVMFPMGIFLLFAGMMGAYEDPFVESRDINLGILAMYIVSCGLGAIAVYALFSAIVGLCSAFFRSQSFGLSLAGLVSSVVAVGTAGALLLATTRGVEWVQQLEKTRYGPDGLRRPTPEQMRR
jgi:hypothetical protein